MPHIASVDTEAFWGTFSRGVIVNSTEPTFIQPDEDGFAEMPYSEVCMHLRVAGTQMRFRLLGDRGVQLYDEHGRPFSFPITYGEAGVYRQGDTFYYYAPALALA